MDHERFEAGETVGEQHRDVAVAAVLAQERLGVPQHEVGRIVVGPRQRQVTGEQRPTLGVFARGLGGSPSEVGCLDELGSAGELAERPAE